MGSTDWNSSNASSHSTRHEASPGAQVTAMHPRSLFTSLVCTTQLLTQSTDPGLIYGDDGEVSAELLVNEVAFIAVHTAAVNETFLLVCDFGEIPAAQSEAVYRKVLNLNLSSIESDRGTFCLAPDSNRLLLVTKGWLASMDVDRLSQATTRMAAHAVAWRQSQISDNPSTDGLTSDAFSIFA